MQFFLERPKRFYRRSRHRDGITYSQQWNECNDSENCGHRRLGLEGHNRLTFKSLLHFILAKHLAEHCCEEKFNQTCLLL